MFGRLTLEDAGGEVQTYTYDNNGNLTSMTDPTGTTVRTYDELNRNTSKIVPGIGESMYDYDIVTGTDGTYSESTTDPKGNVTLKTYDKAGRLSGVTVGEETTTYEYLANGTRHRVIFLDGTTETYAYDRKNQVTGLINAKQDGTVISSYTYTYDDAGNQLTKTEAKGTTTYTYDSMNRLSSVTEPEGKVTGMYTYAHKTDVNDDPTMDYNYKEKKWKEGNERITNTEEATRNYISDFLDDYAKSKK